MSVGRRPWRVEATETHTGSGTSVTFHASLAEAERRIEIEQAEHGVTEIWLYNGGLKWNRSPQNDS